MQNWIGAKCKTDVKKLNEYYACTSSNTPVINACKKCTTILNIHGKKTQLHRGSKLSIPHANEHTRYEKQTARKRRLVFRSEFECCATPVLGIRIDEFMRFYVFSTSQRLFVQTAPFVSLFLPLLSVSPFLYTSFTWIANKIRKNKFPSIAW